MKRIVSSFLLVLSISAPAHLRFPCAYLVGIFPHTRQSTPITCAPSCLHSGFQYLGRYSPGEIVLARELWTFENGITRPELIAGAARKRGLYSQMQSGVLLHDLWRYLSNGEVVIVEWWYGDSGHVTVLTGIDHYSVRMMDPWVSEKESYYSLSYFLPNWYGRVIRISRYPLSSF